MGKRKHDLLWSLSGAAENVKGGRLPGFLRLMQSDQKGSVGAFVFPISIPKLLESTKPAIRYWLRPNGALHSCFGGGQLGSVRAKRGNIGMSQNSNRPNLPWP